MVEAWLKQHKLISKVLLALILRPRVVGTTSFQLKLTSSDLGLNFFILGVVAYTLPTGAPPSCLSANLHMYIRFDFRTIAQRYTADLLLGKMVTLLLQPDGVNAGPQPHILGVPIEIRLSIYSYVLDDIHQERRQWERNATSAYDGLLLACKQLSHEASQWLFPTRITSHQTVKLASVPTTRLTFVSMRSLSIEVKFGLIAQDIENLAKALDVFQLSLQELHLLFIGQDRHGNDVAVGGCANQVLSHTSSQHPLLESGQDVERNFNILRMLIGCRNLRILRIENANLPLLPAMFMVSKPYLQSFSAICDARSITHRYARWTHRRDVLKGLLIKMDPNNLPPIRGLHIDANAVVPAEDIVQCLKGTLQHLSWRVPNPDFQGRPSRQNDFYDMTDRIFRLFWSSDRAPYLETLRFCCQMRNLPSGHSRLQWDVGHLLAALGADLPRFQKLKHFEIHCSGGDNFLQHELIKSLPHGLQRLYLSDVTVATRHLVDQVRQRYFLSPEDTKDSISVVRYDRLMCDDCSCLYKPRIESLPLHELPNANFICILERGLVQYLSVEKTGMSQNGIEILLERSSSGDSDYLDDDFMIGESCFRRDEIPLSTGKLGFITFEYGDSTSRDDCDVMDFGDRGQLRPCRSEIFRLNGQLLDREHNLHLAYDQAAATGYGIKPPQVLKDSGRKARLAETETHSMHASIYAAIYDNADLAPKPHLVQQNLEDLTDFPQRDSKENGHDSMAWYFGNEDQAMKVFELEPVAEADNQRQKPTLMDVEVLVSTRCRWMCPDFEVPPVGFFPKPTIPSDWKELANARQ